MEKGVDLQGWEITPGHQCNTGGDVLHTSSKRDSHNPRKSDAK